MKKRLLMLKKILSRNLFLKLLSLGAAVLLWLIVVININPEYSRVISGVQITVDESSGLLSDTGLHVVEQSEKNIKVSVTGPRYLIGKLTPSDFIVTPDVTPVTKSGKYDLKLTATMKNGNPKIHILSISPSKVQFNFDMLVSKTLPVHVNVTKNGKIADGYYMVSPTTTPAQVVVTGAASEVSQVAGAQTTVSVDSSAHDTITAKGDVTLIDSQGNALNLKHVSLDNDTVNVTVPILKLREGDNAVNLGVDFSNVPTGFSTGNIQYTISPKTISVAAKADVVDALSVIKLQPIDFNTLDINSTVTSNIVIPDGVLNIDNLTSATVTINLLNTGSKMIDTSNIEVVNTPAHYGVTVKTKQISNIKLFGPASDINNVSTVNAVIDMSGIPIVEGQYQVPVSIEVPGKTGYWATGSYTASIYLWKKR